MKMIICVFVLAIGSTTVQAAGTEVDGELVYRDNCSRCHTPLHAFSPRMMATVARHMQVKAGLTTRERSAVLQYLLQSMDPGRPSGAVKVAKE